jgi:hypothetical protein
LQLNDGLFLVSVGQMSEVDVGDLDRLYPHKGLVLSQRLADGTVAHLIVATPDDLVGFAQMDALTALKPVCLPLKLVQIAPRRIHAQLRTDAVASRFAMAALKALTSSRTPAG